MKYLIALIFASLLFVVSACYNDCDDGNYKPYDCNETFPPEGQLNISVTINQMNPVVPIEIYFGDVEDNQFYFADTLDIGQVYYILPNNTYSVKAEYKAIINGRISTVYSIDGGKLSVIESQYCDGDCYEQGSLNLNARLEL